VIALQAALDATGEEYHRFRERVEATMRRRQRINIAQISAEIAEELGQEYGEKTSAMLWMCARNTNIQILDAPRKRK
jgi:hypothetical protein